MAKPILFTEDIDGNIYAVIGAAYKALSRANQKDKAEEMKKKTLEAKDYHHALAIIMEYVEFD